MIDFEKLFFNNQFNKIIEKTSELIKKPGIIGINALLWRGRTQVFMGHLDNAEENLNEALRKYNQLTTIKQEKHLDLKASIIHYKGTLQNFRNEFIDAIEYYKQALQIRQKTGDNKYIKRTVNNLGLVYLEIGDYSKALEYLQKNYALSLKSNDKIELVYATTSLLEFFASIGDVKRLENYLDQLKEIVSQNELIPYQITVAEYEALYYEFQNDLNTALDYNKKVVNEVIEHNNPIRTSLSYYNIIRVLVKLDKREECVSYLEKFKELSNE